MVNSKPHRVKPSEYSKLIKRFWLLFLGGCLGVISLFVIASFGGFGEMPDHTVLENPKTNLAAEIISSDGQTLGKFYLNDNRTPITFDELPKHLVDALIATEDVRFYQHSGIDARATLRALVGRGGGASTISQQLAKQLFTVQVSKNKISRAFQKLKEWIIAMRLERQYTKEEIIAQYFNIYDFGNYAHGIRSAARIYFSKEPKALSLKEAAMLVGMFKNSSLYNPRSNRNPVGTKNRRNVVLAQMVKYGYLSLAVKDSLQQTSLDLKYTPESHQDGIATYFRTYLEGYMKTWINANPKAKDKKWNLYNDGLKIYTTIDARMQQYAETAVQNHMSRLQAAFFKQNTATKNPTSPFVGLGAKAIEQLLATSMRQGERWRILKAAGRSNQEIEASFYKPTPMTVFKWAKGKAAEVDTVMTPIDSMRYYKSFLRAGMLSIEPHTGHVKAWVGGVDYKHFQFDMAKQGKRQAGSTFKPFVYTAAIDQLHLSPCDEFPDTPFCVEAQKFGNSEEWCPKNSGHTYGGTRTLKNALANSVNTIAARLIDKVGPQTVADLTKNLGITSHIPIVPSIALGTPEVNVFEMVSAYATFANKGVYTKPVTVMRIEDKNGNLLYQHTAETREVLSEETAYVAVKLMEGVTEEGSGVRLRTTGTHYNGIITGYPYSFKNPIAGKTGTTQNNSDGWFMGMVPNLVTGVWVGGDDRAVHFKSGSYGAGAAMALPIWGIYMKNCYLDPSLKISKVPFEAPLSLSIPVDCAGNATSVNGEGGTDSQAPEGFYFR